MMADESRSAKSATIIADLVARCCGPCEVANANGAGAFEAGNKSVF